MTEDEMNRFIASLSLATPEPEFNVRNLPSPSPYGTIRPDSGLTMGGGGERDVSGDYRNVAIQPGFRAGPVSGSATLATGLDMPTPGVGYSINTELPGGFNAGYRRMHAMEAPSRYDQHMLSLAREVLGGNVSGSMTEQDGRRGFGVGASHPLGGGGNAFINAQQHPRGGHTVMGGMDMRFARGGYAGGGDPEIQSNGMPVISDGQINWGDSNSAADFARADQAMQAMRSAPAAPEPQAAPRIEPRRPAPVYSAPRDVPRDAPSDVPLPPVRPAYLDRPYEPEGPFGALDMSSMQPEPVPSVSMGYRDVSPLFEGSTAKAPSFGAMENITPGAPEWRRGSFPQEGGGKYANRAMPLTPPAQNQPSTEELLAHLSSPQGVAAQQLSAPPEPTTDQLLALLSNPTKSVASAAIDQAAPQSRAMPAMSPQQRDLIIRTIAAESSGKTPEEGQGIAHVILNRITSGRYGKTPEKVLFAPKQFEPWADPRGSNYPMRHKPGTTKYEKAQDALEAAMGGDDITNGATLFWGPKAQAALGRPAPKWGRTGGLDIGDTRFHRDNGGFVSREHHADGDPVGDDTDYSEAPPLTIHRSVNPNVPVGPMDASVWSEKPAPASPDVMPITRSVGVTPASIARQWKAPEEAEMPSGSMEEKTRAVQNVLPSWNDYTTNLATQTQGAQEMRDLGLANMKSGNVGQGLLGGAQTVMGTALPVLAPIGAAFDTAVQTGKRISPHVGHAVEVASMVNPDMPFIGASKMAGLTQHFADLGPAAAMAGIASGAPRAAENAVSLAKSISEPKVPRQTMASVPDIRVLPASEAIEVARTQPHIIPNEKGFIGAPDWVKTPEDLAIMRKNLDDYIAADPRGGDWYNRYREGVNEVTGGNPVANKWMTSQHGQWSAGVSPQGELGFTVKENNAALAGMPVKSARPAQHEAHMAAIAANDPTKYQLGKKTGEYARLISPDLVRAPGATGVNDFRHARNFGYTDAQGMPQTQAMTPTQHTFMDYETALAVDRANKAKLGGHSNWTGEALQAAPWVRQKALDILDQRPAIRAEAASPEKIEYYTQQAHRQGVNDPERAREIAMRKVEEDAYEMAFKEANKTIADFFSKHTAFGTHEAQPGAFTGHLPQSVGAPEAQRNAYALDPRSSWANAPGNRDAIYGGLSTGETGNAMRVQPTIPMQGMYTPEGGATEFNLGATARPVVGFNSGKSKTVAPADQAILNAAEGLRAYIDAQQGGAWHKPWVGGASGEANSYTIPMNRKATPEEMKALQEGMAPHGLGDIVDTGQGITATSFYPGPPKLKTAQRNIVDEALSKVSPQGSSGAQRTKIDSNYLGYDDEWKAGVGSGEATKKMLSLVNQTPELRAAFDKNPYLAQNATARLERDAAWQSKWGATREDIQYARRVIGNGPGWVGRLETALKSGGLLPAVGAAILGPSVASYLQEVSGRDR